MAEIARLVNPELTIVDARSIVIGNGPTLSTRGATVRDRVDRLIISGDMVAGDVYCAAMMAEYDETFSTDMVAPTIAAAAAHGLGELDAARVEVIEVSAPQV